MFTNNRIEYQKRKIQDLERKELLSPYRVTPEKLERRAKAWAQLADRAKRERLAS